MYSRPFAVAEVTEHHAARIAQGVSGVSKRFVAGSYAGERLVAWGVLDIECILDRARPAHTRLLFAYPYQQAA